MHSEVVALLLLSDRAEASVALLMVQGAGDSLTRHHYTSLKVAGLLPKKVLLGSLLQYDVV